MAALINVDSPERGVLLLDGDKRVAFANRRACEIFGVAVNDLVGAGLPQAVARRSMEDDETVEEVIECSPSPDAIFHRFSSPVYSSDGKIAGRVEIYSDITARRALEEEILDRNTELAELNKRLEDAQDQLIQSERLRTLGEMAAGVAHDINNVLGIILGNAQLARRKIGNEAGVLKSIDAIELAARDGAETVRRLREIGKPGNTLNHQRLDLSEIVEDVVASAVPAWKESGSHGSADVSVETNLALGCFVLGDATELREALANLMLNAAQAIDGRGRVIISTSRDSEHVDLTVEDTGVGMSEETKKRLFDPFFTTRGAAGTGLGMSMVDAIAMRHRAKLKVSSEEGKGTAITMRFPADHGSKSQKI